MRRNLLYNLLLAVCLAVLATGCTSAKKNRTTQNILTECRQAVLAQQRQIDELKAEILKKETREKEAGVKIEELKNKLRTFGVFD